MKKNILRIFSILSIFIFIGCDLNEVENDSSVNITQEEINQYNYNLPGYILPRNKQGISDRNYDLLNNERYEILDKQMLLGIQKYNYYWMKGEDAKTSSENPISCDSSHFLFPSNETMRINLGIKKYHCYNSSYISNWERRFEINRSHNIQVAVVLWTTPAKYRNPGCEGFYFNLQDRYLKEGCYPDISHYDDYEDWIKFTSYRLGKYIDHYIVWNEVESTNWADSSTTEYSKEIMSNNLDFHMNRSFNIYNELFKRTITSVSNIDNICMNSTGPCKNLVYVSLNKNWGQSSPSVEINQNIVMHWSNKNVLNSIWNNIGLNYPWAIAIHPYGDVHQKSSSGLSFSNLGILSQYQKNKIDSISGGARSWLSYPQSRLFASEQNSKLNDSIDGRAKFICEAYDVSFNNPSLIAMTHNHFQRNVNVSDSSTDFAMIPAAAGANLNNGSNYNTFNAYLSTNRNNWGITNNHFCCSLYNLGCRQ